MCYKLWTHLFYTLHNLVIIISIFQPHKPSPVSIYTHNILTYCVITHSIRTKYIKTLSSNGSIPFRIWDNLVCPLSVELFKHLSVPRTFLSPVTTPLLCCSATGAQTLVYLHRDLFPCLCMFPLTDPVKLWGLDASTGLFSSYCPPLLLSLTHTQMVLQSKHVCKIFKKIICYPTSSWLFCARA